MAILNFPSSPSLGDTYVGGNGVTYTFDGVKWIGASGGGNGNTIPGTAIGTYTTLPDFLDFFVGTKLRAGQTSEGIFFSGNDGSGIDGGADASFPIRTNFTINGETKVTVTLDMVVNDGCSDFGMAVFTYDAIPTGIWGNSPTRLVVAYDCNNPIINGSSDGNGSMWSIPGNGIYKVRFTYDPNNSPNLQLETLSASGVVLDTLTYNESLDTSKQYKIGFAADQDNDKLRTYIRNLSIEIDGGDSYTDTLMIDKAVVRGINFPEGESSDIVGTIALDPYGSTYLCIREYAYAHADFTMTATNLSLFGPGAGLSGGEFILADNPELKAWLDYANVNGGWDDTLLSISTDGGSNWTSLMGYAPLQEASPPSWGWTWPDSGPSIPGEGDQVMFRARLPIWQKIDNGNVRFIGSDIFADGGIDIYTNSPGYAEVWLQDNSRVSITADGDNTHWEFQAGGNLRFPDGTIQTTAYSTQQTALVAYCRYNSYTIVSALDGVITMNSDMTGVLSTDLYIHFNGDDGRHLYPIESFNYDSENNITILNSTFSGDKTSADVFWTMQRQVGFSEITASDGVNLYTTVAPDANGFEQSQLEISIDVLGNLATEGNVLYAGNAYHPSTATGFLNLDNGSGNIAIGTNTNMGMIISLNADGDEQRWNFDTSGNLTLARGIIYKYNATTLGGVYTDPGKYTMYAEPDKNISIGTQSNSGSKEWIFAPDGSVTFPDGTVQITAYDYAPQPLVNLDGGIASTTFPTQYVYVDCGGSYLRGILSEDTFDGADNAAGITEQDITKVLNGGGA